MRYYFHTARSDASLWAADSLEDGIFLHIPVRLQARAMGNKRRRPTGYPGKITAALKWLFVFSGTWDFAASQICQDYSIDTGVYWWVRQLPDVGRSVLRGINRPTFPRNTSSVETVSFVSVIFYVGKRAALILKLSRVIMIGDMVPTVRSISHCESEYWTSMFKVSMGSLMV